MAECTVAITCRPLDSGLGVDVVQAGPMENGDRAEPATGSTGTRTLVRQGPPLPGIEVKVVDAAGWLDTGDLGYLVDGEVVICGRAKDVIILGGRNIYPTDIERVVTLVPGVRSGNAVAVRTRFGSGREGCAIIAESPRAGDEEAVERLTGEITMRVVDVIGARPGQVRIVPPGRLPKTPSGKLRRSSAAKLIEEPAAR
jgi:fatty-acyl-CoA synthase